MIIKSDGGWLRLRVSLSSSFASRTSAQPSFSWRNVPQQSQDNQHLFAWIISFPFLSAVSWFTAHGEDGLLGEWVKQEERNSNFSLTQVRLCSLPSIRQSRVNIYYAHSWYLHVEWLQLILLFSFNPLFARAGHQNRRNAWAKMFPFLFICVGLFCVWHSERFFDRQSGRRWISRIGAWIRQCGTQTG